MDGSITEWFGIVANEACSLGMNFTAAEAQPRCLRSWNLDTTDGYLNRNMLSLEVTEDRAEKKPFGVGLAVSHEDRHVVGLSSLSARGRSRSELVELITDTTSRFVRRAEFRRRKLPRLNYVGDVVKHFPATERCLGSRLPCAVTKVDGAAMLALVHDIGSASYGGAPPLRFSLTASYLVTWRLGRRIDDELEKHTPDIVDFSFGYDSYATRSDLEKFPSENIVLGRRLFEILSSRRSWMECPVHGRVDGAQERLGREWLRSSAP